MKAHQREIVHKYLNGELTPDEQVQLDAWMKEDPTFKEEIAYEKNVQKAVVRNERAALKKYLQSVDAPSQNRRPYFWAAASILVLICISIALFWNRNDQQKLYAEFYQPYPNIISPILRGENSVNASQQAFQAYELEDYKTASALFDQLYQEESSPYAQLYAGISYVMIKDFDLAKDRLEKVQHYSEVAQWYLALAHLGKNDIKSTEKILQDLITNDSEFSNQAQQLLKKL